ncbi:MAG: type II toxin-antitoxin system VapC family toxin [Cyanobacteria bacterium P01_D01_bin.71]
MGRGELELTLSPVPSGQDGDAPSTGMLLGALAQMAKAIFISCDADINIVPFDQIQVNLAAAAWPDYGKGRHPAGLNFGDGFA